MCKILNQTQKIYSRRLRDIFNETYIVSLFPRYHICLAVILVDFVFKKDEIYYPHYSVLKRM